MKYARLIIAAATLLLFSAATQVPTYNKTDLMGKFDPSQHDDFALVPQRYCIKNMYLRTETLKAFIRMAKAAAKDGVTLTLVSGTRNRNRQIEIWTDKWNRFSGNDIDRAEEILLYSSMPGTSRHHWGTDFDLNSVEPEYFESGQGEKVYAWLEEHAIDFGFFQPYIAKGSDRKEGYREEKWHWSYYPIAHQMLKAYKRMVSYEDITGFPGASVAEELRLLDRFVMGITDLNERYDGYYQHQ